MQADKQISLLPTFVVAADELALLFDDAFTSCQQKQIEHDLGADAASEIGEIDKLFEKMSESPSLWDHTAIEHSPQWKRVRERAAQALRYASLELTTPDLSWVKFVPSTR